MKTKLLLALAISLSTLLTQAQTRTTAAPAPSPSQPNAKTRIVYRQEMGKWWQNSEVAKKLQLGDNQITQLDQIFYEHRVNLIDYGAEMEKQDLKLQTLLDADVPNEGQVEAQVDQVLTARGKLEREFTMMNLDLRKVLSLEQWRQLKSLRGESGGFGDKIFFHKALPPPGGGPGVAPLPPGAMPLMSLPPPDSDEMY
jgi:Spy/CpxP family protein refolding chaperone